MILHEKSKADEGEDEDEKAPEGESDNEESADKKE